MNFISPFSSYLYAETLMKEWQFEIILTIAHLQTLCLHCSQYLVSPTLFSAHYKMLPFIWFLWEVLTRLTETLLSHSSFWPLFLLNSENKAVSCHPIQSINVFENGEWMISWAFLPGSCFSDFPGFQFQHFSSFYY